MADMSKRSRKKNISYWLAGRGAVQQRDHMRQALRDALKLHSIYPADTIEVRMVVSCGDQTSRHTIWSSDRLTAGPRRSGNSIPTI